MGVSEVAIRRLGNNIVLDFPGSQALSAAELVKASSMYFHVVNEKFSVANTQLADVVNRFLQEVWNEAVVMNRKDPQSINRDRLETSLWGQHRSQCRPAAIRSCAHPV